MRHKGDSNVASCFTAVGRRSAWAVRATAGQLGCEPFEGSRNVSCARKWGEWRMWSRGLAGLQRPLEPPESFKALSDKKLSVGRENLENPARSWTYKGGKLARSCDAIVTSNTMKVRNAKGTQATQKTEKERVLFRKHNSQQNTR